MARRRMEAEHVEAQRRELKKVPSPCDVKSELKRIQDMKARRWAAAFQGVLLAGSGLERSHFDSHYVVDCWLVEYGPLWEEAGWKIFIDRDDTERATVYIEEADYDIEEDKSDG